MATQVTGRGPHHHGPQGFVGPHATRFHTSRPSSTVLHNHFPQANLDKLFAHLLPGGAASAEIGVDQVHGGLGFE